MWMGCHPPRIRHMCVFAHTHACTHTQTHTTYTHAHGVRGHFCCLEATQSMWVCYNGWPQSISTGQIFFGGVSTIQCVLCANVIDSNSPKVILRVPGTCQSSWSLGKDNRNAPPHCGHFFSRCRGIRLWKNPFSVTESWSPFSDCCSWLSFVPWIAYVLGGREEKELENWSLCLGRQTWGRNEC